MDGGAWWASPWGLQELNMTEWLHFHFHALEKEMATHSSVLAWRIPGTGEPGGLPTMGMHRVRHDWRDLAAAAEALFLVPLNICEWHKCFVIYLYIYSKLNFSSSLKYFLNLVFLSFFLISGYIYIQIYAHIDIHMYLALYAYICINSTCIYKL